MKNTKWILQLIQAKKKLQAKKKEESGDKKVSIFASSIMSALVNVHLGGADANEELVNLWDEIKSQVTEKDIQDFADGLEGYVTLEEIKELLY